MKLPDCSRRQALAAIASLVAPHPMLLGQEPSEEPPGRITPLGDFVNLLDFEPMAKRKLDAATFASIAGGDRAEFDRITFRPRMMVDTSNLDLTTELFGQSMFAPILVGPASFQQKIHPEGELAMVRGASSAKAVVVLSSLSSYPIDKIVAEAQVPLWYQIFPGPDVNAARTQAQHAVKLGCKAVVITVGTPLAASSRTAPAPDWNAIDRLRQGLDVPVVVKGIVTPEEAGAALKRGVQGIVVSNYGGRYPRGAAPPLSALPGIADAVAGKMAVLYDGSLRRGTDILKALILGAQAVLITRPPLWGLAVYGAAGVQSVMEMAQTELARNTAMVGAVSPRSLTRGAIKIHSR